MAVKDNYLFDAQPTGSLANNWQSDRLIHGMSKSRRALYLIFDMDGTLIDSDPTHKATYKQFFARYEINVTGADFKDHLSGRMNPDILTYFFSQKGENFPRSRSGRLPMRKRRSFNNYMP
ncbi:HAD hydrolase-like protein [Fibrella arboris]|uniref:HAD hydrolase-like protein n=1 Tax=Fibrella arboris TaxID=3242486 RepID=UPI00352181C2